MPLPITISGAQDKFKYHHSKSITYQGNGIVSKVLIKFTHDFLQHRKGFQLHLGSRGLQDFILRGWIYHCAATQLVSTTVPIAGNALNCPLQQLSFLSICSLVQSYFLNIAFAYQWSFLFA